MVKRKKIAPIRDVKKTEEHLLNNLKNLIRDYHKLIEKKTLAKDKTFLKKIADEIKDLDNDAIKTESIPYLDGNPSKIHDLLAHPIHIPFIFNKSLLDAAITFDCQEPTHSDLSNLMLDLIKYGDLFNYELLSLFWSLCETINVEKDHK